MGFNRGAFQSALGGAGGLSVVGGGAAATPLPNFITRVGDRLYDGAADFRMAGANVNFLGLDFSAGGFGASVAVLSQPSLWRIDDVYETAQIMGCNTVLGATLGMNSGLSGRLYPTLGGAFVEDIFKVMDYAVARAEYYGLRLIIPFIDWNTDHYWGDSNNFNKWGDSNFFTGATALTNFKVYIAGLINRVNTVNGRRYGDDPTIMAWATINEGGAPSAWTAAIAAYAKSLAPNQLVADGRAPCWGAAADVDANSLTDANIDIITDHFYPMTITGLREVISTTTNLSNKVYYIGEYDWNSLYGSGDTLANWITEVEATAAVRGSVFYTLSGHADDAGWAASRNDYRGDTFGAGDDAGYGDPAIQTKMDQLRAHHYAMRGIAAPAYPVLGAPLITDSTYVLQWRGVAGAVSYTIQRSTTSISAGFTDYAAGLNDFQSPWIDLARPAGDVWYRIVAYNKNGDVGTYSSGVLIDPPPAEAWYLAGSVTAANCKAAYRAKGAADYAGSKVNLANPGTNDAADGTAYPTWDANIGWTFVAASSQYLDTGVVPANNQQWSMIIRVDDYTAAGSYPCLIGMDQSGGFGFCIFRDGAVNFHNPSNLVSSQVISQSADQVLGMLGHRQWVEGMQNSYPIKTAAGTFTRSITIGGLNYSSGMVDFANGKVAAVAIYDAPPTPKQYQLVRYHMMKM